MSGSKDEPLPARAEVVEDTFRCYTSRIDRDHAAVLVEGELDLATAPVLQSELQTLVTARVPRITIDLAGVRFLDSSGLAALLAVRRQAAERRVTCSLASVPDHVMRVITLTGTAEPLGITPLGQK